MAYQKRDGSFSLFPNKFKKPGDNKPDFKCLFTLGGVEYEMAAWKKATQEGTKFLNGTVKPAMERQVPAREPGADSDPWD